VGGFTVEVSEWSVGGAHDGVGDLEGIVYMGWRKKKSFLMLKWHL
jgi:hypothetical protein